MLERWGFLCFCNYPMCGLWSLKVTEEKQTQPVRKMFLLYVTLTVGGTVKLPCVGERIDCAIRHFFIFFIWEWLRIWGQTTFQSHWRALRNMFSFLGDSCLKTTWNKGFRVVIEVWQWDLVVWLYPSSSSLSPFSFTNPFLEMFGDMCKV